MKFSDQFHFGYINIRFGNFNLWISSEFCHVILKQEKMKTIFITGASTGLGKTTAKLFQSRGWNVIATMRNPEAETELNQLENVTLLPLDVTNLEQIQTTVKKRWSLVILIWYSIMRDMA